MVKCSICKEIGHRADNRKFHPLVKEVEPVVTPLRNEIVLAEKVDSVTTFTTFAEYIGPEKIKARGFWKKDKKLRRENILLWVRWFELKFNILPHEKEKWYSITGKIINDNGGSGFFTAKAENSFKESVVTFMKFIYPDYPWKPYRFTQPPQGFWKNRENREQWFKDLCEVLEIRSDNDYYRLTSSVLEDSPVKSGPLNSYYNCSIVEMMKDLRPDFECFPWKFDGQVPKNYWNEHENVMFWFHTEVVVKNNLFTSSGDIDFERFYELTCKKLHSAYGQGVIVHKFNGSLLELLHYLFPSYNWQFWKFVSAPNNAWDNLENIKKYFNEELNIKALDELYDYTLSDMPSSLFKYDTLFDLCKLLYPHHEWKRDRFQIWGFSRKACRFMDRLSGTLSQAICHGLNGKEYKIPGTNFKADGYLEIDSKKYIIEYHGCYFHGCTECYADEARHSLSQNGKTHDENLFRTNERTSYLRELGYLVLEMWECKEACDLREWWDSELLKNTHVE